MRPAFPLAAVLLLLLSGCTSSSPVGEAQGLADWAAFQEDAAAGGDLWVQAGRTTLQVEDYGLLLTLSTRMNWYEDGWRLHLDVDEAHLGGEDHTDDYGELALTFACVPGTVAFTTEGMAAFGRSDVDTRASHSADCLDPADHAKVAAAVQQMVGRDFPLDGVEAMLSLTVVPDVAFVSGTEEGDTRTNTYEYAAGGAAVRVTAQVEDGRVRVLKVHAEADGASLDSVVANEYGARPPSP